MHAFRKRLDASRPIVFDGGMGSLLQARGLRPGESPEIFGLAHPDAVQAIHREYAASGAEVVTTNTFGASKFKLPAGVSVREANARLAAMARATVGDGVFVAGSVGPTGTMIAPLGPTPFREVVAALREQIQGLVDGGVDLILAETQFDLAEARAVVVAAREVTDLPVGVSMTFEDGVSLTGTTPEVFAHTMNAMGVDLLGSNCSAGPEALVAVARRLLQVAAMPVLIEPNAGLPELVDGATVFRLAPGPFADALAPLVEEGVLVLGGCCGTTPAHIQSLARALAGRAASRPRVRPRLAVTSRAEAVVVDLESPCRIIGERINPTGKADLTADLQSGAVGRAVALAEEQVAQGADILDINVGAPMVDEEWMLPAVVEAVSRRLPTPLCLDSSNAEALRRGLESYPAAPLINSISGEPGRMELLAPLCRDYGAPCILLPLQAKKLPVEAADRIAIIDTLLEKAMALGLPRHLILVDALALTVSSKPQAARACLEVIAHCRRLGLPCTLGLSNISFGLPARELVNATFLTMALGAGLASCIANPGSVRLQEALSAAEVLLGSDAQAGRFIERYAAWQPGSGAAAAAPEVALKSDASDGLTPVGQAIVQGKSERIASLLLSRIDEGADPFALVHDEMIPAIMRVGEKYERKEYFLPQLLQSAETMQTGFAAIRHLLAQDARATKGVVVMATVEGDIHDIGKNIVCLMLRNHGYTVIDLGKDVPAQRIVDAAQEHQAHIIGLSALMTTTMVRMEDTVRLVHERGLNVRIMVGGAVVTQSFADRIGADGYSVDAVAAVRLADDLMASFSNA